MNNNEIFKLVESGIREGKSKSDIFRELGGTDDIARAVAATPYFAERKRYQKLNWALVAAVIYFAIIKLAFSLIGFFQSGLPIFAFPILLFVPAVAIWIAVNLSKFRGGFYIVAGLLSLAVLINGMPITSSELNQKNVAVWAIVHIPLLLGCFLAFFLKNKLCPHLGYMGAKTDPTGKYLFLSEAPLQP